MLLRITSKLKLGDGWRAGLLAEVPFVDKKTTTFESNSGNSSSSENKFGIGDAAFQAYLAHDLDQNWALGSARAGLARQRKTRSEPESGKSCRASGCAIPSPILGRTPILFL